MGRTYLSTINPNFEKIEPDNMRRSVSMDWNSRDSAGQQSLMLEMNPRFTLPSIFDTFLTTLGVHSDQHLTEENIFARGVQYVAIGKLLMGWAMYKMYATLSYDRYQTKREALVTQYGVKAEDVERYRDVYSRSPDVLYTLIAENGIPTNLTLDQLDGMADALQGEPGTVTKQTERNAPAPAIYQVHVKPAGYFKKQHDRAEMAIRIQHGLTFGRDKCLFLDARVSIAKVIV
jgi:hypothetical protein